MCYCDQFTYAFCISLYLVAVIVSFLLYFIYFHLMQRACLFMYINSDLQCYIQKLHILFIRGINFSCNYMSFFIQVNVVILIFDPSFLWYLYAYKSEETHIRRLIFAWQVVRYIPIHISTQLNINYNFTITRETKQSN